MMRLAGVLLGSLLSGVALADEAPTLSAGNTAWMLTATALVLFMTIPGLALFYGGMVRKKNVLATLMQSFFIAALVSVLWVLVGYSLAFAPGNGFIGGFDKVLLYGVAFDALWPGYTIPEMLFMVFQMTFAIITPALIAGAFAERMKFSALIVFVSAWLLVVYAPIAHWVWEGTGWLFTMGALDYAGGTVVHINAGIAGLVAALMLGKRVGYGKELMAPHNLVLTLIGASMLWVGWFGFNAGSSLNADARAAMAMVVTQVAAAAATLSWVAAEWVFKGKPSLLGAASGAVAGLVCITPASGFVTVSSALILGLLAGVVCYWGATSLKRALKYDDSLDAFGVHGVGGILGSILTGVFATNAIAGGAVQELGSQLKVQLIATGATIAYSLVVTAVLLKLIDWLIGLRVSEEEEREGLDIVLHGEHVD
ncbi:ammonium transporter [Permianibacter fluminis]|uniref:ammonium transporter n=1 Tax=Permianibacter fluminis TaxID=2738515 RepID=UPI0038B2F2D9